MKDIDQYLYRLKAQNDRIEAQNSEILALLQKKKRVVKPVDSELVNAFDAFWQVYPKKKGKSDALKAWLSSKPPIILQDLMIADIKDRIKQDQAWQEIQFIPQPASYIRGEKWTDALTPIPKAKNQQPEIFSQAFESVDVNKIGRGDADLDESQNPYGDMK